MISFILVIIIAAFFIYKFLGWIVAVAFLGLGVVLGVFGAIAGFFGTSGSGKSGHGYSVDELETFDAMDDD